MNIKNTYFGFTDKMEPMKKARVEKMLDNLIRYNGNIMTEKEWIYEKLMKGYRPVIEENYQYWKRNGELSKPKTLYKLDNGSDFFEINKTLSDYASHIVQNDYLDEQNAEKHIAMEEEEKRMKKEQEEKERIKREEEKERERQERERRRIERLANIQITILSFTHDELKKIDKIVDRYTKEYNKLNKDNVLATEVPDIMRYYDIMNFIALAKLYPESAISSIKYYRDLIDPNSRNINWRNENHIERYRIEIDVLNAFFGLTDDMSIRTIREVLTEKITAEEAHDRVQKNEQRKEAQRAKMTEFYRLVRAEDGCFNFVKTEGERLEVDGIVVYEIKENGIVLLIEERTGSLIAKGKTKTEAKNNLKEIIEKYGIEKIDRKIQGVIKQFGVSPLFEPQTVY